MCPEPFPFRVRLVCGFVRPSFGVFPGQTAFPTQCQRFSAKGQLPTPCPSAPKVSTTGGWCTDSTWAHVYSRYIETCLTAVKLHLLGIICSSLKIFNFLYF